ncbi:uncharacterized protein LOC135370679 isoform X2 [Ornithodoros turicata]|uniref:uncharacterized protein LOC135370679 isoform X2 n=1 Tax=Ornithodoros turicata TaxID=34597 RepID=UPI0031396BF4
MKVLACLVVAFYVTGSGSTKLPKKIQFGTYVLYDTSLMKRSTTGIGVYTKRLFNADNAIVRDPNAFGYISGVPESLHLYLKKESDQDIQNADILLYISGAILRAANVEGKYYKAWSPSGTICTPNKGVAAGLYNPDFDKMESIMFGILRLLGSDEIGGVAANLRTKSESCLRKKPQGVYSNVTKLPGHGLDGTAYCIEFADNNDEFSLCETLNDGCTLSCCWNNEKREFRRTSAPDGFKCGSGTDKMCFMDKCVPRKFLKRKGSKKTPRKA